MNTTATTTASVSALHVTGSFTAQGKTYDGTTSATVTSESPGVVVSTDAVALSGGAADGTIRFPEEDTAEEVFVGTGTLPVNPPPARPSAPLSES